MRALVTVFLFCVNPAWAQRSFTSTTTTIDLPGGSVSVGVDKPRSLRLQGLSPATIGARAEVDLPFDVPGKEMIPLPGRDELLVPGVDSAAGHGFLVRVRIARDPWRLEIVESRDYGPYFDPYLACWNEIDRLLYVFDFAGERILAAPWDGKALPELSAFKVAATRWQARTMEHDYLLGMSAAPGGSGRGRR